MLNSEAMVVHFPAAPMAQDRAALDIPCLTLPYDLAIR